MPWIAYVAFTLIAISGWAWAIFERRASRRALAKRAAIEQIALWPTSREFQLEREHSILAADLRITQEALDSESAWHEFWERRAQKRLVALQGLRRQRDRLRSTR